MSTRYTDLNSYLRGIFGCRVQKITVDAGLTCPNRDGNVASGGCIYCNSRGAGTDAHARGLSITDQLEAGKAAMARRYRASKFIAYFQSFSNTYAPAVHLKALYDEALAVEGVIGLSIGTRPDCVSEPVLTLLQDYSRRHLVWVEYGLQSARDATLAAINRGHDSACFLTAVAATRACGLPVCAHIILGLPNETRADMQFTAAALAAAAVDGVKIHCLYVVRGTRMETQFNAGDYRCLEREEYADLVVDVLERLPARVIIHRLTGDPHPDELIAPDWCRDKSATLAAIRSALERRDTWQGRRCGDARNAMSAAS
ncbi:MAG: TIGR01212 family radical SAM protein [Desulfobacterales bacterium]|jgi:radical SAM protein (TIGR01212 family)|nr:TIGR01212 family radical SAM protein [Desulfobacterales bacterium]